MSQADRSGERAGKWRPKNREIKCSGKESWKFAGYEWLHLVEAIVVPCSSQKPQPVAAKHCFALQRDVRHFLLP